MALKIFLLGRPQVVLDGHDLTAQMGGKPLAVLAYLALGTPPPLAREKLATVFWQDKTDEAARYRLRNTLWSLRRDLGQVYIGADDIQCWLNATAPIEVDVLAFQSGVKALRSSPASGRHSQDLLELANLYQGDFLESISVRAAPLFEEWLLIERERLQLLYQDVLWVTAQAQQATAASADAIQTLKRLIQADPLRERNYRALMNVHARAGDRTAALRVYEQCARTLVAELAIAPAVETQWLRAQIAQGRSDLLQADLEQQLAQAEAALAEGRPEYARTLIQSARQAIQNLFR